MGGLWVCLSGVARDGGNTGVGRVGVWVRVCDGVCEVCVCVCVCQFSAVFVVVEVIQLVRVSLCL